MAIIKHEIVLIEWLDSRLPSAEWEHLNDIEMPTVCKCISVGWLLKEDKDCTIITAHIGDYDNGDQVMGIVAIPTCTITKRIVVNPSFFAAWK